MHVQRVARSFCFLLGCLILSGCGDGAKAPPAAPAAARQVVLFSAHDDIFSRPVAEAFEKKTGIKVLLMTDVETAKTVGLVNRLIARKDHPEADVFWNNEIANTFVLKEQGVLERYAPKAAAGLPAQFRDADGWWTGFAARARVILYNKELVPAAEAPRSIWDLALPRFKGRAVIARPLAGTTLTHAGALFSKLGPEKAKSYFQALAANQVKVAVGNAMARNLVANGEAAVCLTDTDDANGAFIAGRPVEMVYPDQEGRDGEPALGALIIPNTVMLIKGAPHPETARQLIEYLLSPEVEAELAKGDAAQMPVRPGVPPHGERFRMETIKPMAVDWADVARQFEAVKKFIVEELRW
jgi:iron(III) transport system substrate-binding protein